MREHVAFDHRQGRTWAIAHGEGAAERAQALAARVLQGLRLLVGLATDNWGAEYVMSHVKNDHVQLVDELVSVEAQSAHFFGDSPGAALMFGAPDSFCTSAICVFTVDASGALGAIRR